MECISGCHYILQETPLRREPNTVPTRIWNAFLDCNYFLMSPQGYGMYSRLSFYFAENSAEERVKYSSNKDMECIFRLELSLLKAPLGRESTTLPQRYGMYF